MSEPKWNWVYYPYLDAPNKQEESALKAGFYHFGFGGEFIVNDEMDDVSDWAKDEAKKLMEAK